SCAGRQSDLTALPVAAGRFRQAPCLGRRASSPQGTGFMAQIDKFLELLIQFKGSDLHIAVGVPPMLRVNGKLKRVDYAPLTAEQVEFVIREIMTEKQRGEFEKFNDTDFAYESGFGRFRVNAFQQKNGCSAVFRVVPTKVPT